MSGAGARRVLVIGLDMGDGGLIRQWSRMGRLPGLAALAAAGVWFDLETPAEVLHTSAWPSFATGMLPGRHGVYYPYQPKPGYQLAQHIGPDAYGAVPFWTLVSRDRHALVYDVPETFPEAAFRGRGIFDWGTWAWYGTPQSQPRSLLGELSSQFGPYPLGLEAKRLALRVPDRLEERLLRAIQYKAASASWLLQREPWDLAVVGFCETHPAGHYLWPAGSDASDRDGHGFDSLFRVYAAVDEAIARVRASAPTDTFVIVVSGDGVRPNHCGWHLLPTVLERLGLTRPAGSAHADGVRPSRPSLVGRVHGMIPASARRFVTESLPWRLRDRLGVWLQSRHIDWSQTRAFALPTDLEGCIRLNVAGREPHGIVEPGAQYRAVCEEIRQGLEELENPDTGCKAVTRVWIRDEVFPGPRREQLPDIVVTWNDEAPVGAVASKRVGMIRGNSPDLRTGTHSTNGFALASSPGLESRTDGRGRLVDIAPTVLALLGVDGASQFDGSPLLPIVAAHTRTSATSSVPVELR
jgi:predicted AlkP superfamily phosphohydrolase/phosphomutase